ncbi:HNH endonuclease [Albidovulum sp.]|uniref:HNH endonuclease n=1 Tax=Albidovulum sp. TaxID=1872424 RepID=UPI0039B89904
MAKAVYVASSHSAYKDRPGEWYHFPNMYLGNVARSVGDWVIFYQGRRGGVAGYYAVQRVERIVSDPSDDTHSYAMLDRASELSFERAVPRFRSDGRPYETGLPRMGGNNTWSVRLISESDFAAIIAEGLRSDPVPDALPREGAPIGLSDPGQEPFLGPDRQMILTSRAFRDQSFARQVRRAYAGRCAMSGLELRNGGGRPEVEAAHILPVEERGPDTVRNGLALSGTIHWMFDRGLVSVDADNALLIARGSIAAEVAGRLFVPDRRLIVPSDPSLRPHPAYLDWHRQHRFKG